MVPVEVDVDQQVAAAGAQLVHHRGRGCAEAAADGDPADEWTVVDDLDGCTLRRGERGGVASGPRLEVPRVVLDRMVGGELEHRRELTRRNQLTCAGEIDDRADVAGAVPPHREARVGHRRVGQHDPVVDRLRVVARCRERRDREGRHPHGQRPPNRRRAAGTSPRSAHRSRTPTRRRAGPRRRSASRPGWRATPRAGSAPAAETTSINSARCDARVRSDALEDGLGIGVDPGDRRAGQDVVELLGEHLAPEVVDVGRAAERRRPQLGLDQQSLAAAVAELRAQLARERAPVRLEVQLAAPDRNRGTRIDLGFDPLEELIGCADFQRQVRIDRGEPAGPLEHLAGRAAAAVAVTERHQRLCAPAVVAEVAHGVGHLDRGDLGVVRVDRREVGQHPACRRAPPTGTCCAGTCSACSTRASA